MTVRRALAATVVLALLAFTGTAGAAEPRLTVTKPKLRAALKCTPGVKDAKRTPVMLVTGTGASGDEAYGGVTSTRPRVKLSPILWPS